MTRKPPLLPGHDPNKAIGRFTASGVEFNDGMTPENFRLLAYAIAGPKWKTHLPGIIGRCRSQVWQYANGKQPVPKPVAKLLGVLAGKLDA